MLTYIPALLRIFVWLSPTWLTVLAALYLPWKYLAVYALVIGVPFVRFLLTSFRVLEAYPYAREDKLPAQKKRIAVIGAGPSGVASVKCCVEEGHEVVCFEKQDTLGGVFAHNIWGTAHLTSSPFVTAFSDFPPVNMEHKHWHASEYVQYLEAYVRNFDLTECFQYRTVVTKASLNDGQWTVETTKDGKTSRAVFDHLVVSSGSFQQATDIPFPGRDAFTGRIVHSSQFNSADDFKGQKVVVVGIGESSADITKEVAEAASECYLAVRRGCFVIPRTNPDNDLNNDYDSNRVRFGAPIPLHALYVWYRYAIANLLKLTSAGGAVRYNLLCNSEGNPYNQFATKSNRFVEAIVDGKCVQKPGVKHLDATGAVFSDGSRVDCDAVILCHGFDVVFPFLQHMDVPCLSTMYNYVIWPEMGDKLAFVGFARPAIGSIPPISEIQARWFALLASGRRSLPTRSDMQTDIKTKKDNYVFQVTAARLKTLVTWIHYNDILRGLIGCRPNFWSLVAEPSLLWRCMTGGFTGFHNRLAGPHAKPDVARKAMYHIPRAMEVMDLLVLLNLNAVGSVLTTLGLLDMEPGNTLI